MNSRSHHERKSSESHYQIRHALPRCEHRFRLPTNYRRMSGGNAGEASTKERRNRRWTSAGNAVVHAQSLPLSLSGNFPAIVGALPARLPTNRQTRSEQLSPYRRRINVRIARAVFRHGAINPRNLLRSYARP